jgi:hypothetical protein
MNGPSSRAKRVAAGVAGAAAVPACLGDADGGSLVGGGAATGVSRGGGVTASARGAGSVPATGGGAGAGT